MVKVVRSVLLSASVQVDSDVLCCAVLCCVFFSLLVIVVVAAVYLFKHLCITYASTSSFRSFVSDFLFDVLACIFNQFVSEHQIGWHANALVHS